MYDFAYSMMLTEIVVDAKNEKTDEWRCSDDQFKKLLNLGPQMEDCGFWICETPVPEDRTMIFVDNHDRQRERWKDHKGKETPPVCDWDVKKHLDSCLLNFKYGHQYHVTQSFLLTQDYGDTVRLMSSYAFFAYRQGPPGISVNSMKDVIAPVYTKDPSKPGVWNPTGCRGTPVTSPVTAAWDEDQTRPWICEHRWQGMGGLVRFRKLVYQERNDKQLPTAEMKKKYKWADKEGRIAYSVGAEKDGGFVAYGFVALSRGWNWYTQCGFNQSRDLAEHDDVETGMPAGTYCNLASIHGAVPWPDAWKPSMCTVDTVTIGEDGKMKSGKLLGGGILVIHHSYQGGSANDPEEPVEPEIPVSNPNDFWGWKALVKVDDSEIVGCCFTVAKLWQAEPGDLKREEGLTRENCLENKDAAEGDEIRRLRGWNRARCPSSAEEAYSWIEWGARGAGNETGEKEDPTAVARHWIDTSLVIVFIVVGELAVFASVLCCCKPSEAAEQRRRSQPAIELGDVLLENRS